MATQIPNLCNNPELLISIAENMKKHGGSFVQALARKLETMIDEIVDSKKRMAGHHGPVPSGTMAWRRSVKIKISKTAWTALLCVHLVTTAVLTIGWVMSNRYARKLETMIDEIVDSKKRMAKTDEDFYQVFNYRMTVGRSVYQWRWYQPFATRLGTLYLDSHYPMTDEEYDGIVKLSWRLNRYLCIPKDDEKNFVPLGDLIQESALYPEVKHKTGEYLALAGFMKSTTDEAIKIYNREVKPIRGSDLYIEGLNRADPNLKEIFKDPENVVRLWYVYFRWLLERYEYNWEFALTAYHFGPGKTDYWWAIGLRTIPRYGYRRMGKWEFHFMKGYSRNVFEIAHSLWLGESRPSRGLHRNVVAFRKVNEHRQGFVDYLRIEVEHFNEGEELKQEIKELNEKHTHFEQTTEKLLATAGKGMNMMLDAEYYQKRKALEPYRKIRNFFRDAWRNYQDQKEEG